MSSLIKQDSKVKNGAAAAAFFVPWGYGAVQLFGDFVWPVVSFFVPFV